MHTAIRRILEVYVLLSRTIYENFRPHDFLIEISQHVRNIFGRFIWLGMPYKMFQNHKIVDNESLLQKILYADN